jgi:uncharacterized protein DUF2846
MRNVLVILLLAISILFPSKAKAQTGPGCGPVNVKFDMSTSKDQRPAPAAEPGKAVVFFLQDDLKFDSLPRPTTRFAIDGTWVGATHANSYFYVYVDPGEHHLCANWQSIHVPGYIGAKRSTAAAQFTAETGKTYYFRARDIARVDHPGGPVVSEPEVLLEPVDGDEAQVLMGTFSFSSSHQKK